MKWVRAGKEINEPLTDYLEKIILEEKENNRTLQVSVGTDSQINGNFYKCATVVLLRVLEDMGNGTVVGRGGKVISATYDLHVFKMKKQGVNERMLKEVEKSIEVAYEINPVLEKYGIPLEVHIDVNANPRYESNKALNEAIGWVMGMGYAYKIKPDSYAATHVGDKYAK